MPLFPKRTTEDKLSQAKQELLIAVLLLVVGGGGWALVLHITDDIWWPAVIFLFMTMAGFYILMQALFGLVIDFTVGRPAIFIVATVLVFGGLLMEGYQLLTSP
jgi:hypothetical protein